jgi:hypothetical protein
MNKEKHTFRAEPPRTGYVPSLSSYWLCRILPRLTLWFNFNATDGDKVAHSVTNETRKKKNALIRPGQHVKKIK